MKRFSYLIFIPLLFLFFSCTGLSEKTEDPIIPGQSIEGNNERENIQENVLLDEGFLNNPIVNIGQEIIYDENEIDEVINDLISEELQSENDQDEEITQETIPDDLLADFSPEDEHQTDEHQNDVEQQLADMAQQLAVMEQQLANMERLLMVMEQLLAANYDQPENDLLLEDKDELGQMDFYEETDISELFETNTETAEPETISVVEVPVQERPSQQSQPPVQTSPPAQERPPQQTQPPVQPQPPVQTPPPAQERPPQQTQPPAPQPQTPPPSPSTERPVVAEETIPPRESQQDFPSGSAARIDSLTQMGMTPLDSDIAYSRIVRATVGQILEIPFRGTGWVYLGELASRRGIVYNSRRNDTDGQSFIFTLEEAGTFALKFFRQDFIRDFILNDHVQVIVGEAPATSAGWFNAPVDRGRVIAQPRWPSSLDEAQIRAGTRPPAEPVITGNIPAQEIAPVLDTSTVTQGNDPQQNPTPVQPPSDNNNTRPVENRTTTTVPPAPPSTVTTASEPAAQEHINETNVSANQTRLAPEVILQRSRETFDGGNVAGAITLLNQFMDQYPGGSDEVYWLMGQFYEANSPSRNILLSLEYYRKLINEYPQSRRFNDAQRRIAYLERFYINIQ